MVLLLGCATFIVVMLFAVIGLVWRAWVFQTLFGWFIVPVTNLPQISLVTAIGIFLLVGLFRFVNQTDTATKETDSKKIYYHFASQTILVPWFTLLFGWAIKSWFM